MPESPPVRHTRWLLGRWPVGDVGPVGSGHRVWWLTLPATPGHGSVAAYKRLILETFIEGLRSRWGAPQVTPTGDRPEPWAPEGRDLVVAWPAGQAPRISHPNPFCADPTQLLHWMERWNVEVLLAGRRPGVLVLATREPVPPA